MTTRVGSVDAGIDWLERHFLDTVAYDHAAGATTRYGPRVANQKFLSTSTVRIGDCSGIVIRGAVEGGMPRYHEGLPESSGDCNRWADHHSDLLLWSKHGGGRYRSLDQAIHEAPRGAVFGIGDYRNGDSGHEGLLLDPGGKTLESSSGLGGVRHGSIFRFGARHPITHLYELPMLYGAGGLPPAPPSPTADLEEATVIEYLGHVYTFWLADVMVPDGHGGQQKQTVLRHHVEWWPGSQDLSGPGTPVPNESFLVARGVQGPHVQKGTAFGDILRVGAIAADGALIQWTMAPNTGFVPKRINK